MSIRNVLRIEKKKRVSADTNITDAYKVPYGQSNVGSALDELNAEIGTDYVSVTADGVKTYAEIFAAISAQINIEEYSDRCYFKIGSEVFQLCNRISNRLKFTETRAQPGAVYIITIIIGLQNNIYTAQITTSGTSVSDNSSAVPPQGTEFLLHR